MKRTNPNLIKNGIYSSWSLWCIDKNGHCNIPTTNLSLRRWIARQRILFTSKKLKAGRYEKLVGIGFAFEDEIWNRHFMELVEY
jgi:hypothetical protein